ncbi:ABC transporter ATP-binding protein [Halostagnicola bangensis]
MNAVVEATDLHKTYGETVALESVSLAVDDGEVFALIGPNGAGKTTLVRALTGTTNPDSGTAHLLDESPTAVDRNRLGVLPQEFSPPARLTARELLEYYAGLYDESRDPETVLADVGLVEAGDTWYENLSGGQKRRVCVGSALVNDPDVLFLDEPTTGIDPAGRRTVWRLIEDLAAGGTTVLLTTHDMAEAERLADRVGLLADGSLIASGTPATLVDEHGGSSRLTVEPTVETDLEGIADGGTLADLEYAVETRDDSLVFEDVSPADIGSIVDVLEDEGLEYTSISWAEPDLETVYLELADGEERAQTDRRSLGVEPARADASTTADSTGTQEANPEGSQ